MPEPPDPPVEELSVPKDRKVAASRVIAADRQTIFDLLADPTAHARFDGSGTVQAVQDGGPQRLHEGARFGMKMKMGAPYRILNTVVEFDEGERIAWRHVGRHRWRYELEDAEGGTRVTETFDWSTALVPVALELVGFPRKNLAAIEATLDRLDEVVTAQG